MEPIDGHQLSVFQGQDDEGETNNLIVFYTTIISTMAIFFIFLSTSRTTTVGTVGVVRFVFYLLYYQNMYY